MIPKRLAQIIEKFNGSYKTEIENSYRLAAGALAESLRGNGHPFIEHPLNVAYIVAEEVGLTAEAVVAVFLHEATRGNNELLEGVKKEYSEEIIAIAKGLNNISGITTKETLLQAEQYRKLIISYSKDPRVTLIKLADRLEIMRNLDIFPKNSVLKKVTETLMLYIPIAHQLGLYNLKSELEDLCFRHSDPTNYRIITNKLKAGQKEREHIMEEFIKPLEKTLAELDIHYKLKVRTKTAYSIWKKMQKQKIPYEQVFDVFALRFILDVPFEKEHDYCWEVFSRVTETYKPDTGRLRDWITTPKKNGYESLHTTVENSDGAHIEVQIRTERMDEMAENGHASHWSYKGVKRVQGLDEWLLNVKHMLENSALDDDYNAKENISLDEIFVFTPTGDIKQLPKGASVLDFAFNIHSNLGVTCSGAKVNGRIYSIRDELHTGDVVEIMSNKNQKPSADWLNIVVSSRARGRIKNKLKEEEGKLSKLGREILERRMKNWKLALTDDILNELCKKYKFKTNGELHIAIQQDEINMLELKSHVTAFIEGEKSGNKQTEQPQEATGKQNTSYSNNSKSEGTDFLVIGDKLGNLSYTMAKCCNPIFGDDVFGFISSTGGIKIHRIGCPNASRLLEMYPYRVQKVKWREVPNTTQFQATLKVIGDADPSSGQSIMDCAVKQGGSIRAFSISERVKPGGIEFVAQITISIGNNAHLDRVVSALRKLPSVKNVLRG